MLKDKPDVSAFYEFHAGMQESWDGPALLVFSDGRYVGAALDRNGLRPARYLFTDDDLVVMMSETGVVDIDDERVTYKGRLGPGQMLAVDLATGEVMEDEQIKCSVASKHPYESLLKYRTHLDKHHFGLDGTTDVVDRYIRMCRSCLPADAYGYSVGSCASKLYSDGVAKMWTCRSMIWQAVARRAHSAWVMTLRSRCSVHDPIPCMITSSSGSRRCSQGHVVSLASAVVSHSCTSYAGDEPSY
jgi:hypothetical protein